MAQIIYKQPSRDKHAFHVFTNLDFWDARKVLRGLAVVRRNFGEDPPGWRYPTQVVAEGAGRTSVRAIERRLHRAVPSPPRHVVVEEMLNQPPLETPHFEVTLQWDGDRIRADRVRRTEKYDPVIQTPEEQQRRQFAPACF